METRAATQPGAGFAGGPRRIRGRAGRTTERKVGRDDSAGQRSVGASEEAGGGRFACAEQEDERGGDSSYRAGGTSFARWAGGRRRGAVATTSAFAKATSYTVCRALITVRTTETVPGYQRLRSQTRVRHPSCRLPTALRICEFQLEHLKKVRRKSV